MPKDGGELRDSKGFGFILCALASKTDVGGRVEGDVIVRGWTRVQTKVIKTISLFRYFNYDF